MIFVTVGMHTQGFDRLLKKMDEIAGTIDEEVVIQTGGSSYIPRNAKHFDFVTESEFRELCRKARVVVTHGAMTIVDALEQGTPVIAVPRLRQHGEVIDDHQLYLAQELAKQGKVEAVTDVEGLAEALARVGSGTVALVKDRRLVEALKRLLEEIGYGWGGEGKRVRRAWPSRVKIRMAGWVSRRYGAS
ncbi:MAG: beta-1,4-galactosyltransferase [Chloroflexi bacterium]|nr:MAG: beta-1,4-galactosyltransferase [Chloroflexota bacterium]